MSCAKIAHESSASLLFSFLRRSSRKAFSDALLPTVLTARMRIFAGISVKLIVRRGVQFAWTFLEASPNSNPSHVSALKRSAYAPLYDHRGSLNSPHRKWSGHRGTCQTPAVRPSWISRRNCSEALEEKSWSLALLSKATVGIIAHVLPHQWHQIQASVHLPSANSA